MATTLTVKSLKAYIDAGLNVVISGVHGVGKTAKLSAACEELGLKVKYYSASTLDPYTDLVGIPVPDKDTKTVEYYRPHDIDEAEVVFFDEFNRAEPKTLNTLFEIIQFGTINGEKLPKLKCVVAAMNPVSEDYDTDELDAALLDRFDVFLTADPEIDMNYFVTKYGERLGTAAVRFWKEYEAARTDTRRSSSNPIPYISPRRMDKIVAAFRAIPARQTVFDTLPRGITDLSVIGDIHRTLGDAMAKPKAPTVEDVSAQVRSIIMSPISEQRKAETGKVVAALLASGKLKDEEKDALLMSIATSLRDGKSAETIVRDFGDAVKAMKRPQFAAMTTGWAPLKLKDLQRRLAV